MEYRMMNQIRMFATKAPVNKRSGVGIVHAVLYAALIMANGCATKRGTGALAGGGVGALIGQAAGRSTQGTLIGAAVGTGIGYIIGNEMDKKEAKTLEAQHTVP